MLMPVFPLPQALAPVDSPAFNALTLTSELRSAGYLSLLSFGAATDGVLSGNRYNGTDNTSALQSALNAADAAGKSVVLPPGMYRIAQPSVTQTAAITVPSRCHIVGTKGKTILLLDQDPLSTNLSWLFGSNGATAGRPSNYLLDTNEFFRLEGVTIRGLQSQQPGDNRFCVMNIRHTAQVEVENNNFEDITGQVSLNYCNGLYRACRNRVLRSARNGFRSGYTPNIIIDDNYLENCDDDAIASGDDNLASPDAPQNDMFVCRGNQVVNSEGIALWGLRNAIVTGNVCKFTHGDGLTVAWRAAGTGEGSTGNIIVTDNVVENPMTRCLPTIFDASSAAVVDITGNKITFNAHGLVNGNYVTYNTSGTAIGGLTNKASYYVVGVTTNTFQLSSTAGGSAIDLSSLGTATDDAIMVFQSNADFAGIRVGGNPSTPVKGITVDGSSASVVSVGSDTITSNSHPFLNDDHIRYYAGSTAANAIGGLTHRGAYFVVNKASNTFQLSLTAGGAAIDLTALGTGTSHTFGIFVGEYANATDGVLVPWGYDTPSQSVPKWGWMSVDQNDTLAQSPSFNIVVARNVVSRTKPAVSNFSDYGIGTMWNVDRALDPAITDSSYHQHGILLMSDMQDAQVVDNIVYGFPQGAGIYFYKSTVATRDDENFKRILVGRNRITHVDRGISSTQAAVGNGDPLYWDILFEENMIDVDPYLKNVARTVPIDGTWQNANWGQAGINMNGVKGCVMRRNTYANCYVPISPRLDATQLGQFHIENELVICEPAGLGATASNKGVGYIPRGGDAYRFKIVGSDPNLSTFKQLLNVCMVNASTIPTTGTYVSGSFVRNTAPAIANARTVVGWSRLTTGSAHTLNTDWALVNANAGDTASVTATIDGSGAGTIPATALYITVTSIGSGRISILPAPEVGRIIRGNVGANGFKLQTVGSSGQTINNVTADGTAKAAIPANCEFYLEATSTSSWILKAWDNLGAPITAIIPA